LPVVTAQITFRDSPSHYRYRYGLDFNGGKFKSRAAGEFQVAIVELGIASGPIPSSYDFYAPCLSNVSMSESDEPKTPTVPIDVLGSTTPLANSYTVPLCTLMRISDVDPLTQGTKLILIFKQDKPGGQITICDAFKTTQSSLAQSSNAFVRIQLSLAQALQGSRVLAGCRLLDWIWADTTESGGVASTGDGWHLNGQVTQIQQIMKQAAIDAPPFLSFAIYTDLDSSCIDGAYEPMVRSYLKLTKDLLAWQKDEYGALVGPERGSYGLHHFGGDFSELSLMVQWAAIGMSPILLPDPNYWETAVLEGTNPTVTQDVLSTFCGFALVGSKQNEYKMMGLLDSPDKVTRLLVAEHFAAISATSVMDLLTVSNEQAYLAAFPDRRDKYMSDLKTQIDYWKSKAPGIIANLDKPSLDVQHIQKHYQYFK